MLISTVSSYKSRPTKPIYHEEIWRQQSDDSNPTSILKTCSTTHDGVDWPNGRTRQNKLTGDTILVVWYQRKQRNNLNESHEDTGQSPRVAKQRKLYNPKTSQTTYTPHKDHIRRRQEEDMNDESTSNKSHTMGTTTPRTRLQHQKNKRTHPLAARVWDTFSIQPRPPPYNQNRPVHATGHKPRKLHTYWTVSRYTLATRS